ncbi:MAG TPA: aminopeptidase [Bacillales bacterium]|nr:aminopeptidase [Bacillales bacterium]
MSTFEKNLEKYAELVVRIGNNVQKGQTLLVHAPIETIGFVRKIAEKAYEAGAKHVYFDWEDDVIKRTKFELAPDEAFHEYPEWKAKWFEELAENGATFLNIRTPNPDLLTGIDSKKISAANKAEAQAIADYKDARMKDKVSWCVISAATKEWALKVFPDLPEDEALEKLWETIFKMTRVDREDPVAAWSEHQSALNEKVNYLNEKKFRKLHYTAPGTDLTIELPEGHLWVGGAGPNEDGVDFFANIPTEEVFTMPLKTGANGKVTNTKPFNYHGSLIDGFTLTFENGRIVECQAETGEEILENLIDTDEGSHYLGEMALVPYDSPISQSGLIFYNTLYDENASCHLAIGKAYPSTLEGGSKMSAEQLKDRGANNSLVHEDFMIGSADLDIDGITDNGETVPLFRNGNWVI